jgi:hypothetical protein
MKDLKEHITESLLDDFDDIADKIQTNPFKSILDAKEKIEPLTTNFLSGGNFDTYYYTSIYKLPKHIEKCYLDIVSKLKPGKDVFLDKGFGREILSGERLVKKIS